MLVHVCACVCVCACTCACERKVMYVYWTVLTYMYRYIRQTRSSAFMTVVYSGIMSVNCTTCEQVYICSAVVDGCWLLTVWEVWYKSILGVCGMI